MMEKDKLESLLIDYIDGQLSDTDRSTVEYELLHNAEAQKLYKQLQTVIGAMEHTHDLEPPEKIAISFNDFLEKEIQGTKVKVISITPWYYKVAAAIVLILVAGGVGYMISQQQDREEELLALKHELEMTRQLVMSKLGDDQSASQRMLGVQAAYEVEVSDHEIVNALIKVMNEDPNSNVRLSAIEALGKFQTDEKVKKALIASLSIQTDPVVQIALIQLMVQMREKGAVKQLQQIINDDKTLPAVKDEAYASIFKLT